MKLKIPYQDKITFGYSVVRSAQLAAQQFSLPLFEFLTTGKKSKKGALTPQKMKSMYAELFKLLKKDAENISKGLYPVEVLKAEKMGFTGAFDAMRRLIFPLLKDVFPGDGEGLHFLEIAAGTGRLTRFMKLAYPKARITVLDLSDPFLKKAQDNLYDFDRLDFVQGSAEDLPFKEAKFDLVYSCFLFHELPIETRRQAVAEAFRVLKDGGLFGFVDSVQKDDAREFEWALEQFPIDFNESFYENYIMNPMEGLMTYRGFEKIRKEQGFFAKAVLGKKPFSS